MKAYRITTEDRDKEGKVWNMETSRIVQLPKAPALGFESVCCSYPPTCTYIIKIETFEVIETLTLNE